MGSGVQGQIDWRVGDLPVGQRLGQVRIGVDPLDAHRTQAAAGVKHLELAPRW